MKICAGTTQTMGLSNRLRPLLSAMRIARRLGCEYCLHWPVMPVVSCRFGDLFEMPVEVVDPPMGEVIYSSWRLKVWADELPAGWAKAYPSGDVAGRAIDLEYERIPRGLREQYLMNVAALGPRMELRQRAEALTGGDVGAGLVSVHIRDGEDWAAWGRSTPLENFLAVMDRYPAGTRFFVAAHVPATVELIKGRYPGRVICQEAKEYAGATTKRMQDALVDLLCLARGSELIGTFGSTFTEMAWWMGGCRQKVKIVEGYRSRYQWL